MKLFIVLLALVAVSSASHQIDNFEVDPNIDSSQIANRLASALTHKLLHRVQQGISTKNAVNDMIIELLEGLRDQFETGFPDSGIPPLDPFTLDEVELSVSESFILNVQIILRDVLVKGLKEFIISNINFRILALTLEYEFIVPQLDYSSEFEVDGSVASVINVNPSGEAKISMTDLITWGSIRVSVNGTGYLRLVNFNIDYDADNFNVYLEGLFENNQINAILNFVLLHLSNDFFQGQREGLTAWLVENISVVLAEIISEIRLQDIIG